MIHTAMWLSEPAYVPAEYIHIPWEMPTEVQAQAGRRIGKVYPASIVDHALAKERALRAYGKA
jgi:deoxyribodipyrimidine photo-lyase